MRRQLLLPIVGAIALVILAVLSVEGLAPSEGPVGSSTDTQSESGLAAYATLLGSAGHSVTRLSLRPAQAPIGGAETVMLLDPGDLRASDVRALRRFVVRGGTLVTSGPDPALGALLADPPQWGPGGDPTATPVVPALQDSGVNRVRTADLGSWRSAGSTLPVLGGVDGPLLTVALVGKGTIAFLADASPLQNQYLASADNAALGLRLSGRASRPVVFLDPPAPSSTSGLAALPTRWKWVLIGLLLAALTLLAARFRRLGAAAPVPIAPVPPRLAHVEALGVAIGRSGDRAQAGAPLRAHARSLLVRRARLDPGSDEATLAAAASALGLRDDEVSALSAPAQSDAELLAAGRALARLSMEVT